MDKLCDTKRSVPCRCDELMSNLQASGRRTVDIGLIVGHSARFIGTCNRYCSGTRVLWDLPSCAACVG